jgi:hypothetical protein
MADRSPRRSSSLSNGGTSVLGRSASSSSPINRHREASVLQARSPPPPAQFTHSLSLGGVDETDDLGGPAMAFGVKPAFHGRRSSARRQG